MSGNWQGRRYSTSSRVEFFFNGQEFNLSEFHLLLVRKQSEIICEKMANHSDIFDVNNNPAAHIVTNSVNDNNHEAWIFGYGSLCWFPGFEFEKCITGYIRGYVRRFWQGNVTHRGTIERPGVVATLVEQDDVSCIQILRQQFKEN